MRRGSHLILGFLFVWLAAVIVSERPKAPLRHSPFGHAGSILAGVTGGHNRNHHDDATDDDLYTWVTEKRPLLVGVVMYIVMLTGIITASVYDRLMQHDEAEPVQLRQAIGYGFTPKTWQGILVSPLIFGVIYVTSHFDHVTPGALVLAYQNGFFWRVIIRRMQPKEDTTQDQNKPRGIDERYVLGSVKQ
jgi:hypothetical protein